MRKPIIAGNWKMHMLQNDAKDLINALWAWVKNSGVSKDVLPEIVVAPVYTSIPTVVNELQKEGWDWIKVSGQNCHWEEKGAFTGEISVQMLKDAGCKYIIIGHSERRQYFSETDEMINKKAKAILAQGLTPIICCGETLEQREQGVTDKHIASQIEKALDGLSETQIANSVIAYEPIWAIGTGKTCDAKEANRVIAMIRNVVKSVSSASAGDSIRILYGGSVKPETIEEQMSQSDIDGALVGGASLKADSFAGIIDGCMKIKA